jgi:hypothetical protein
MYGCGHCYFLANKHGFAHSVINIDEHAVTPVTQLGQKTLYSAYIGPVVVDVNVVDNDLVALGNTVKVGEKGESVDIKLVDAAKYNLSHMQQYDVNQLIKLQTFQISLSENEFTYYCMLLVTEKIYSLNNINLPKEVKDAIMEIDAKPNIKSKIDVMYPQLVGKTTSSSLKDYQALRKKFLEKLCGVDILFNVTNYLEFLYKKTKTVSVNGEKTLVCLMNLADLDNAFWTGSYMIFGNGKTQFTPLSSIDVVGHELTHGFIEGTCDLEYKGHSGALNESYADIVGSCFEFFLYEKYNNPKIKDLFGSPNWLMGEVLDINSKGQYLRSMSDPESANQPSKFKGKYYANPNASFDYGGVHINSGIPNHCFYNVTQSLTTDEAFKLFIETLLKLSRKSNFMDFRDILTNVSGKSKQVLDALKLVGLTPGAITDYGTPKPQPIPVPLPPIPRPPQPHPSPVPLPIPLPTPIPGPFPIPIPGPYPSPYPHPPYPPYPYPQPFPQPYPPYPQPYPPYPPHYMNYFDYYHMPMYILEEKENSQTE